MSKPQPTKYDRKAVYTGRRLSSNGKVYHRFELLPERESMYFTGVVGVWLGHTYECTDDRIAKRPKMTDDPREDNAEWEAADAEVDAKNAQKRAEAKIRASTKPALKKAVEALRPLVRGKDYFARKALIEYLAELSKK